MKSILLITALAIGSSSVAEAQRGPYDRPYPTDRRDPTPYSQRYDYDGDDYYFERDRAPYERFDRTRWHRDYRSRWVTLANGFSASTNRQNIPIRGQMYDRLRIEAVRGTPMINQVAVIYVSGATQVIKMGVRLPRGAGEVLRLNNEPIQRIVVYTDPRFGGAYGLHAAQGRNWNRFRS
jgi:hypothetical protein